MRLACAKLNSIKKISTFELFDGSRMYSKKAGKLVLKRKTHFATFLQLIR